MGTEPQKHDRDEYNRAEIRAEEIFNYRRPSRVGILSVPISSLVFNYL